MISRQVTADCCRAAAAAADDDYLTQNSITERYTTQLIHLTFFFLALHIWGCEQLRSIRGELGDCAGKLFHKKSRDEKMS